MIGRSQNDPELLGIGGNKQSNRVRPEAMTHPLQPHNKDD